MMMEMRGKCHHLMIAEESLQTRVMLLVVSSLLVSLPVGTSLVVLAPGWVLDLIGRFHELHAEALADVPCDVAVESFFQCVSGVI